MKDEVIIVRKFLIILLLTISITSIVSTAGAQDNTTANNNSTTGIQIRTESSQNTSPTETAVATKEQKFRVGPTVRLRPLNSEINKSADGLVEVFMNNPNLNDVTLEVDMAVDVPSDIYIYAEDGGMTGGAGTVTGHFTVPPGSSRTITLHIKGEKVGTYPVHFSAMYWPGNNKDKWNPINLDSSFEVKEPSTNTQPTTKPMVASTAAHNVQITPGFGAATSFLFILMMGFLLGRK
jgi:hypothetical protein